MRPRLRALRPRRNCAESRARRCPCAGRRACRPAAGRSPLIVSSRPVSVTESCSGAKPGDGEGDAQRALRGFLDVDGRIGVGRGFRHAFQHALDLVEAKAIGIAEWSRSRHRLSPHAIDRPRTSPPAVSSFACGRASDPKSSAHRHDRCRQRRKPSLLPCSTMRPGPTGRRCF